MDAGQDADGARHDEDADHDDDRTKMALSRPPPSSTRSSTVWCAASRVSRIRDSGPAKCRAGPRGPMGGATALRARRSVRRCPTSTRAPSSTPRSTRSHRRDRHHLGRGERARGVRGHRAGPTAHLASGYDGLVVTVPAPGVTDEELDAQIDRLRDNDGELVEIQRPAIDGDFVTIDIHGTDPPAKKSPPPTTTSTRWAAARLSRARRAAPRRHAGTYSSSTPPPRAARRWPSGCWSRTSGEASS